MPRPARSSSSPPLSLSWRPEVLLSSVCMGRRLPAGSRPGGARIRRPLGWICRPRAWGIPSGREGARRRRRPLSFLDGGHGAGLGCPDGGSGSPAASGCRRRAFAPARRRRASAPAHWPPATSLSPRHGSRRPATSREFIPFPVLDLLYFCSS